MNQEFLNKLESIIESNLDNDQFSVEDLAKAMGQSRSTMHRKISELTGQSTSQFIREYRLRKAYDLLVNKEGNVSEVAYKVGFNSLTYFSSSFTEFYGFRPSEAHEHSQKKNPDHKVEKQEKTDKYSGKILVASIIALIGLASFFFISILNKEKSPFYEPKSLAVLPLENLTGDENNSHFVDGLHDALIGELGQLSDLQVISRTSTLQFKDPSISIPDIANRLQVNNIMEGSVYQAGDSIRIQLQLIQTFPSEKHLWAENFDRKTENIISLFNEVTRKVAGSINLVLNPSDSLNIYREPEVNPEAYRNFVIANDLIYSRSEPDIMDAIDRLEKSIEIDPDYADAHASLAFTYGLWNQYGYLDLEECLQLMEHHINKAFALEENNGMAYLAFSYMAHKKGDEIKKEEYARRATELMPNNAQAYFDYSEYLRENSTDDNGKDELSKLMLKRAYNLDPLHPWVAVRYAERFYEEEGDLDEALRRYNEVIELKPDFSMGYRMKATLLANPPYSQLDQAFITLYDAWKYDPDSRYLNNRLNYFALALDWKEFALHTDDFLSTTNPDNPNIIFRPVVNSFVFGDYEKAIKLLESVDEKYPQHKNYRRDLRHNLHYRQGNYKTALEGFIEVNPDINKEDSINNFSIPILTFYSKLLYASGDTDEASKIGGIACGRIQNMLYEADSLSFYNYDTLSGFQMRCLALNKEYKELTKIIENDYFSENIKYNWPQFLNLIYFDEFSESEEFAPVKNRIYNDLHQMRANVIAYLKEQNEWRPEMEPGFRSF